MISPLSLGFKSLPACQELISVNKAIPIRITAFQLLYWLHFNLAFEPSGWHINYPVSAKLLSSLSSKINAEAHRLNLDEICYAAIFSFFKHGRMSYVMSQMTNPIKPTW